MNRSQLATIHILKKDAGLSDTDYRLLLKSAANVTSAKDLVTYAQYSRVIDALQLKAGKTNFKEIKFNKSKAKTEDLFKYSISVPHEPWKYIDAIPETWKNLGKIISDAEKHHVTVVGCIDTSGKKYFKYRPMIKGRDYLE